MCAVMFNVCSLIISGCAVSTSRLVARCSIVCSERCFEISYRGETANGNSAMYLERHPRAYHLFTVREQIGDGKQRLEDTLRSVKICLSSQCVLS